MNIIPLYYFKEKKDLEKEISLHANPIEWSESIVTHIVANGIKNKYTITLHTDDLSIDEQILKNHLLIQSTQFKNKLLNELKILNKLLIDALIKGLLIMFGALSIIYLIDLYFPKYYYSFIFREALYIIGWVSMWKSIELLIFDRTLIKNKLRIVDCFSTYIYTIKRL
jgi:hypothetical protein